MIEGIQYPVTRYTFDIVASGGDLRIEMEPTQFDVPSAFKIKTYCGNGAPETELKRYFHDFGFGMQGHRIDLGSGQAFPSDIYNVLVMSRGYLQDGKQESILDFQVRGFIPSERYSDLVADSDEDSMSDDAVLESAGNVLMVLSGKELGENVDSTNSVESARIYFKAKMQGKTVKRAGLGDIRFSNKGWKKFRRGITTDIKKAKLLPAAPVVIQRGKHTVSELYKDRNDSIVRFHFFDGKIELEDEILLVGVTVGEDDRGHLFYNLNHDPDVLIEKRKAPSLPELEAQGSEPFGDEANLNHGEIVHPSDAKVKGILESAAIDREAHKAASSPKNSLPEPTEAQKESGNYRKGHLAIQGLSIAIENPVGSERSGIGQDGKKWTTKMRHHYGYIKSTKGRDKDHLDVFLGPDPEECNQVFIVNQVNPETGAFDEHKIMLGFETEEEARAAYLSNYEKGWQGIGSICTLFMDEFKDWLKKGDTTVPVERGEVGSYRQDPSWIGVDLDGTLARHESDVSGDHIGEPIPLMMTFVKHLLQGGKRVKIFTARASDPEKIPAVKEWLEKHGLGDLEVTNIKDQNMIMLYDDRAAKVIRNTGVVMESGYDWKSEIQAANSLEDIEDVFSRTFPTAVKERKPSVPTEIIDAEVVEAPWKLTFPAYEAYRINIGRHDEPTDLWAIYKDAMQSAIDAVKPVPPDVLAKYHESIRAEDAVSPLRYDPSTDRYRGRRLIRGDIVIDTTGARYFIDRVNGYMLTLQEISAENKAVPGGIVSVSVDPSDRERYRRLFRAGENIYSKTP